MFKKVRIQNFRQFKDLTLDNLAQINLITGANNTGKTSLLEALFLLDGPSDPTRTLVVAQFRGVSPLTAQNPELWNWLFYGSMRSLMSLEAEDESKQHISLVVRRLRSSLILAGLNGEPQSNGSLSSTEPLPSLVYEAQTEEHGQRHIEMSWTSQGFRLEPGLQDDSAQGFFLPDGLRPGRSEAVRVSRLVANGQEETLVESLRVIEPRLKQIQVLDFGQGARIHVDLGEYPLVPLAVLGQGFGKLLTILAAMILHESPIYFIDEIGEGFHYSTLPDIWKVIVNVATQHSAQVFATTHSLEVVNAAVEGSQEHEGSLAFYRLDRIGSDVKVVHGADDRLRSAVRVGYEIR